MGKMGLNRTGKLSHFPPIFLLFPINFTRFFNTFPKMHFWQILKIQATWAGYAGVDFPVHNPSGVVWQWLPDCCVCWCGRVTTSGLDGPDIHLMGQSVAVNLTFWQHFGESVPHDHTHPPSRTPEPS